MDVNGRQQREVLAQLLWKLGPGVRSYRKLWIRGAEEEDDVALRIFNGFGSSMYDLQA